MIDQETESSSQPSPGRFQSTYRRARKILKWLQSFDPDQVVKLTEEFEARQSRLENAQRHLEATQRAFETAYRAVEASLNGLRRDFLPTWQAHATSFLDIKNLGYELGRMLGDQHFTRTVEHPGSVSPKSKLCTQADIESDWFLYWCKEMRVAPIFHRKIWELCYICQVLYANGKLGPGKRGLGFGCGQEPLPSLFAKYGVEILATDIGDERAEAQIWRDTNQHAANAAMFRRSDICEDPELLKNISFQPVDMNAIPRELDGKFDFCWSACALEHLGNLANGLKFIENSLRTLKPGGIAVHTTEFTINDGDTIDNYPIVLYQRRHLEELAQKLREDGYTVADLDFDPGTGVLDRFVDLPPFTHPTLLPPAHYAHLKLVFDGYTCTSVGFITRAV